MLAFLARATDTEIVTDNAELAEARWLSRNELRRTVATGELRLPSAVSVARWQIETWLGAPLEDNRDW
jgi:NAD+ diphosphatase